MSDERSAGDRLTFFLIGAGIGATLAMLFTPKSGREMRHTIASASRQGYQKGADAARSIGDRVSQGVDRVKGTVERQKDNVQHAVEAGKQAYREERNRSESSTSM
ncbi:MAG: YtxH domain-containing protein [Candidatus Eisenbacteria bacterium]